MICHRVSWIFGSRNYFAFYAFLDFFFFFFLRHKRF
jgi:hypothetical protein